MSKSLTAILLKISAILWAIWGLVHMIAGYLTISQDTPQAIAGISDAVDPDLLLGPYHEAAGALINQHGFNLLWIGAVTLICSIYIWRKNPTAIFIGALVGGLTDLGYFIYMDLGGFVNFMPGTGMTLVSSSAIILSFVAYFKGLKNAT